ncbi:hypothetical protein CRE_23298 [Caenorhabditis remanei]|uniref:Uncharacterized protein n=1 Tax=Caenorhabditis remanei TaxID=31234 RepID=E3MGL1_CAERE|nr:hypothetical protein CRE_23298 [Caenorhabditis remanei]
MTTKGLLLCAISLAIGVLVESADVIIEQLPKEDCDKYVKDLNDQKRAMVKKLNIADGYELTWDPEIVKKLNETLLKEERIDNESGSYYLDRTVSSSNSGDFFATPSYFQGSLGVPGSKCAAGYANNDGLCSLIPPTTTTEKSLTKPPEKPSSEAKDKDSVEVTEVTSGSSPFSIIVAFLLFFVSFTYWF